MERVGHSATDERNICLELGAEGAFRLKVLLERVSKAGSSLQEHAFWGCRGVGGGCGTTSRPRRGLQAL